MTIRIVATSDNHLGKYYARMPVRVLDERRRRIRRAFGHVVDYALDTRANLLLLAGDLFDTPNPRNPDRIYLARRLHELQRAGIHVIAIAGNHDAPRSSTEEGGYPPLALYQELDALYFFDQLSEDRQINPVVLDCAGRRVAVSGFTPNTNLLAEEDPLEGVTFAETEADLHLLLTHFGIEGTMYPGTEAIIGRETLKQLRGVDLLVAGNVHSYETFYAGETKVVIPGATEWMDFGEGRTVIPGFAEIEVDENGDICARQVKIEAQSRVEMFIAAAELDPQAPTASVIAHLEADANPDALARLTIEGALDREVYARLNLSVVEDRARELFFFCEVDLSALRVRFKEGQRHFSVTRRSVAEEIDHVVKRHLSLRVDPYEQEALGLTHQELLVHWQELEQ